MKREDLENLSKDELADLIIHLQDNKPLGWNKLRELVWERDGHTCRVCGLDMRNIKAWYDCGHIIDRLRGGPDELDNLVTMCVYCNQNKPLHDTREDYEQWLRAGYWRTEVISELKAFLNENKKLMKEFAPNLVASDANILKALRLYQLTQLHRMTGRPSNLKTGWLDEFYCEWKEHA
jgi:hypothetical protein